MKSYSLPFTLNQSRIPIFSFDAPLVLHGIRLLTKALDQTRFKLKIPTPYSPLPIHRSIQILEANSLL